MVLIGISYQCFFSTRDGLTTVIYAVALFWTCNSFNYQTEKSISFIIFNFQIYL